jgi:PAS domain S-box-containing protein
VVAIVAAVFVWRPGWVASADNRTCDALARWAGGGSLSGRVAVVSIDERSLAEYGRWPWPRDLLARLIKGAASAGASMVALDIILSEPDREGYDAALADAMRSVPTVVGYAVRFDSTGPASAGCESPTLPLVVAGAAGEPREAFFQANSVECTAAPIAQAAAAAGFLNAAPDRDGRLRRLPLIIQAGSQYYPSLALAAWMTSSRVSHVQLHENARGAEWLRLDDRLIPLEERSFLRLRFRGGRSTFPYISAADLVAGRLPKDALKGKIVVVGASAAGLESTLSTPTDSLFPALEVHATALDNLVQGDALRRPADGLLWELSLAFLAGAGSLIALAVIGSLRGGVVTAAIGVALWLACVPAAKTGLVFSPLPAIAALAGNFVVLTTLNYRAERKRAESAEERTEEVRQEGESRYRRLVENVNDAIIVSDLEGRLAFANRRFREWFGLGEHDVRGLALEDYVAAEYRDALREQHRRLTAGEAETGQLEYEGIRADGTRIWIEALTATVKEGDRIAGVQSALRDTTERRRLEAQYLQAQKMESVGRLAGGVAHDFNNLLTVINGYCELLGAKLGDDNEERTMLRQIQRAGLRAAELTAQLLTFSRKEAVQRKSIGINAVVEEAGRMLQRVVGEDVEVVIHLGEALGAVLADSGQIHQVLMNLVVNARDSMPQGGRLTVETRNVNADEAFTHLHPEVPPGAYVCLAVSDTGTGMSEDVRSRIFEPFFTTKEKGKGTGLGLATVDAIVRQCRGSIVVESKLGSGTRFEIYLPRVQAAAEIRGESTGAPAVRGWETILLVEDQAAVRQLTEDMLRAQGFHVLPASGAAQAISLARTHEGAIDLLITDVILPHMNGRALADSIRADRPEMKVLYISGYSGEVVGRQGVLEGGTYLPKPYSAEALASKVREVLGTTTAGAGGAA